MIMVLDARTRICQDLLKSQKNSIREQQSQELDLSQRSVKDSLVKKSPGSPLYFMQQLNLAGEDVLVFYDSGAMFNLIQTKLARKLGLRMTSRRSMYVVGAGNNIHSTGAVSYTHLTLPTKA